MIHWFRTLLIRVAKILPFVFCFILILSYCECIVSLCIGSFSNYEPYTIPYKPISWAIAGIAEYGWNTLAILAILSIAVETCIWNKLSIIYLGLNLFEKSYFDFELEPTYIYIICTLNIIVAGYLTFRGLKILLSK